jgi:hypothetical protein
LDELETSVMELGETWTVIEAKRFRALPVSIARG